MADYFDEHGVTEEQMDRESKERLNPFVADLFDYIAEEVHPHGSSQEFENTFLRLANAYKRMVEERGDANVNEGSLLYELIVQLLTEAREGNSGPPAASKEFIQSLPSLKAEEYKQDDTCPICTDQYSANKDKDITRLPCFHSYHKACLVPWLELHHTCPSCRYEVPSETEAKEKEKEAERAVNDDEEEEYDPMYG